MLLQFPLLIPTLVIFFSGSGHTLGFNFGRRSNRRNVAWNERPLQPFQPRNIQPPYKPTNFNRLKASGKRSPSKYGALSARFGPARASTSSSPRGNGASYAPPFSSNYGSSSYPRSGSPDYLKSFLPEAFPSSSTSSSFSNNDSPSYTLSPKNEAQPYPPQIGGFSPYSSSYRPIDRPKSPNIPASSRYSPPPSHSYYQPSSSPITTTYLPPVTPAPPIIITPPLPFLSPSRSRSNASNLEQQLTKKIREAERQMRKAKKERKRAERERKNAERQKQIADQQRQMAEYGKRMAEKDANRAIGEIQKRANNQMRYLSQRIQQLLNDLNALQREKERKKHERETQKYSRELSRRKKLERNLETKLADMVLEAHRHKQHCSYAQPHAVKVLETMLKAALSMIRPSLRPCLEKTDGRLPLQPLRVDPRVHYVDRTPRPPRLFELDQTDPVELLDY